MTDKTHLYVLWTNDNTITAKKMVFMYVVNAMANGWWQKITLIVWGATAKLVSENADIQGLVKDAQDTGVFVRACKGCADQLGVTESLEALDIEVAYMGVPLTNMLKNEEALLTL